LANIDDALGPAVREAAALLARHLTVSSALCFMVTTRNGDAILTSNAAMAERLATRPEALQGQSLWKWLPSAGAGQLQALLLSGGTRDSMWLNFVGATGARFTLFATIEAGADRLVVIGEPPVEPERRLHAELQLLNNELAVIAREHAQGRKLVARAHAELESVHRELKDSHWHLRKIQEFLPICMMCHKVKTADGQWDELARFVREHTDFLTHGYCPQCQANALADIDRTALREPRT
jgi:hypothetical protein